MNEFVMEILNALERSKIHAPKDFEFLAQDENVMMQVMELEYNIKSLADHLGVPLDLFPTVDQLEDDEVKMIVEKIIDTWSVYNYFADLPQGLPIRIAYTTLLSVWNDEIPTMPEGRFHFDFYELELEQYVKK